MADTIVTNSPGNTSDSSGWAVAVIILLAVVVGGFFMWRYGFGRTATQAPTAGTNVNVTLPVAPASSDPAAK